MKKIFLLIFILLSFCLNANSEVLVSNKILKCPDSPNCVVSLYPEDKDHHIEPISDFPKSIIHIKSIFKEMGLEIVSESEIDIHATATSGFFKFVDDIHVEVIDEKIHFRSASRKGYYDFGVNRKRVNAIKDKILQIKK